MRDWGLGYRVLRQPGGLQEGRQRSTNRYISRVFLYGVRISVPTLALLFTSKYTYSYISRKYILEPDFSANISLATKQLYFY